MKRTKEYALLKKVENKIYGFCSIGRGYQWIENFVCPFEYIPSGPTYFKPGKGCFIIKIGRTYPDIEFTGKVMRDFHENKHWVYKNI